LVHIVRLGHEGISPTSPLVTHHHTSASALPETLRVLNGFDVVIMQHEYGIYEGPDGSSALEILDGLNVPVVTVLHTVISKPTLHQRFVMQSLLEKSDFIVTLSKSALRTLLRTHDVDMRKTRVIPHGAPRIRQSSAPHQLRLHPRILTWGLLSSGKGIEWGIQAMARLTDIDPSPEYYVVGRTHPKVEAQQGTVYRDFLAKTARRFGVADRVHFLDSYLDTKALTQVIETADIYLLPYDAREQVTSGVLAEALIAGGPVIATRFPHASELLGDGTGLLVEHESPASMAGALRRLILQPDLRTRMRDLSLAKARGFHWPAVAKSFTSLALEALRDRQTVALHSRRIHQHSLTEVSA
jgi:glycosyltransferase involved in cell wall biosynthesis